MQARQYMRALAGGQGNVLTHHKTIEDLQKYFGAMGDNPEVKSFLKNITSDTRGYGNCILFQIAVILFFFFDIKILFSNLSEQWVNLSFWLLI